jgi:D-serine deaminase-like pyridoxal phosphate-dependent protein
MNIIEPTLLLSKQRVFNNISRMTEKAKRSGVRFRPHFKTHQSRKIGSYFRDYGVKSITVSSLNMAIYFAEEGWNDITVAFPVNIREINKIKYLSSKIKLNLLFESGDVVSYVDKFLDCRVAAYIKIDTGYRRSGIESGDFKKIEYVMRNISKSKNIFFKGFLTHSGHTYHAKSIKEIINIYNETVLKLNVLKQHFGKNDIEISIGDTPSCSIIEKFSEIDEIRPGNFVFYDYKMLTLGVCKETDIAVALAVPVVAVHKTRKNVVVYGGSVHLSKDYVNSGGKQVFGIPVEMKNNKWGNIIKDNYVESLSQEHGILKLNEDFVNKLKPGHLIHNRHQIV